MAVAAQPGWAAGTWHPGETLVRRGSAADVGVLSWRAPDGVGRFSVVADVEVTDCYNGGRSCETDPVNTLDSVVGTRLEVLQRRVAEVEPTTNRL